MKATLHLQKRSTVIEITPIFMDHSRCTGSVAERSKALVLGTSLFGGVGSNPTAATDFE